MNNVNSEKEATDQIQFWEGNIRKGTLLNRKYLKQDTSEKDTSEKGHPGNENWTNEVLKTKHQKHDDA